MLYSLLAQACRIPATENHSMHSVSWLIQKALLLLRASLHLTRLFSSAIVSAKCSYSFRNRPYPTIPFPLGLQFGGKIQKFLSPSISRSNIGRTLLGGVELSAACQRNLKAVRKITKILIGITFVAFTLAVWNLNNMKTF